MNLLELKKNFLEYIEIEKGRALRTVENYDHYLTIFLKQTKITEAKDISNEKVRDFRIWLNRQSAGNNRATGDTMKKKNTKLLSYRSSNFFKISYKTRNYFFASRPNRISKS
ncbi:MAG: site-specific integrase [bacterium]